MSIIYPEEVMVWEYGVGDEKNAEGDGDRSETIEEDATKYFTPTWMM